YLAHPGDGVVGKIRREVIVRITRGGDQGPGFVKNRVPVVHVAAVKAIEIIKTEPVSPPIEWSGGACFPNRSVMVLADPCSHVAVLPEDFTNRSGAARQNGGVAVISCGRFADYTGSRGVVIAPGDEGSARRAA